MQKKSLANVYEGLVDSLKKRIPFNVNEDGSVCEDAVIFTKICTWQEKTCNPLSIKIYSKDFYDHLTNILLKYPDGSDYIGYWGDKKSLTDTAIEHLELIKKAVKEVFPDTPSYCRWGLDE